MFSSSSKSSRSSKSSKSSRSSKSSSSGYGLLGFLRGYEKNVKTRRKKAKKREQKRKKREEKLLQERLKQELIDDEEFRLFKKLKNTRSFDSAFNIAKYIIDNKDRKNNGSILDYFCKTYDDIYLLVDVINSIMITKADVDDCYKILLKFLQKYTMECREYKDLERHKPNTHIDFSDCDIQLK